MLPFRVLDEKEVLEAVAMIVGLSLPESDTDLEINASFTEDGHSVEVYLLNAEEKELDS